MACVVDHLRSGDRVRVLLPFVDAHGTACEAGAVGRITALELDFPRQEIVLAWRRDDGLAQTLRFALAAREGPGNGRMKSYFRVLEETVPPAMESGHSFADRVRPRPPLEPAPSPDGDPEAYLDHVGALAVHGRFDEAGAWLAALLARPDPHGGNLRNAADSLCRMAIDHGHDADAYGWLKEQGLGLWYAWGAGATSGGEGASRALSIRAAEAAFAQAEKRRKGP